MNHERHEMKSKSYYVYTDGENLFIARNLLDATAMFVEAFGGDLPREHGVRLTKLRPRQMVILLDEDGRELRYWALTVARCCPGQTILTE